MMINSIYICLLFILKSNSSSYLTVFFPINSSSIFIFIWSKNWTHTHIQIGCKCMWSLFGINLNKYLIIIIMKMFWKLNWLEIKKIQINIYVIKYIKGTRVDLNLHYNHNNSNHHHHHCEDDYKHNMTNTKNINNKFF